MRIQKKFQGKIPENKILNMFSKSLTDTYSCDFINNIIGTGEITVVEQDPTVPEFIKNLTQDDIDRWNNNTGGVVTETDPIFTKSPASGITQADISNWRSLKEEVALQGSIPTKGEDIWIKTAKNLCHMNNLLLYSTIEKSGNIYTSISFNDDWVVTDFISVKPNTTYTLSGLKYGADEYNAWYDENKNLISTFERYLPAPNIKSETVTSPSNARYVRFSLYNGGNNPDTNNEIVQFQFEQGSVASAYEPYSGETNDIYIRDLAGNYKQFYQLFPVPNGGVTEETDPTVPDYVKNITEEDINNWNNQGGITEELDPTVPEQVKSITQEDIDNWNNNSNDLGITIEDINNWNNKQDALVSGVNIKTIDGQSILGSGNISTEYTAGEGISIEGRVISNTITSYNDLKDLPFIPTKITDLIGGENLPVDPDNPDEYVPWARIDKDNNFLTDQTINADVSAIKVKASNQLSVSALGFYKESDGSYTLGKVAE